MEGSFHFSTGLEIWGQMELTDLIQHRGWGGPELSERNTMGSKYLFILFLVYSVTPEMELLV